MVRSRASQLASFLELIKEYYCKEDERHEAVVKKYEIDELINYLNRADDNGRLPVKCDGITFTVRCSNMDPRPRLKGKTIDVILTLKYELTEDNRIRETKTKEEKDGNIDIYECNIQIKGKSELDTGRKFAWHLDCEENTDGKFVHPRFHFHAGGKKISGIETGGLLMISSPRIAYPPMDLPLAINFVIRNFVHRDEMSGHYAILKKKPYKEVVVKSELAIMKPYFCDVIEKLGTNQNHYFPVSV